MITGFAENHGFDGNLFNVAVSPDGTANKKDWPLIGLIISIVICLIIILLKVFGEFTGNASIGLLIFSLFTAIVATMCTHIKFNNNVVTIIAGVGIVALILIGFGVLTPKEVIEKVEKLAK